MKVAGREANLGSDLARFLDSEDAFSPLRSIAADGPSLEITDDAGRLSTVLGAVSLRPPMPAIPPEPNPPSFRVGVPVTRWVYAFGPSTLTLFDQAGNESVQISGAVPPSMVIKGGAKNDVVWKAA